MKPQAFYSGVCFYLMWRNTTVITLLSHLYELTSYVHQKSPWEQLVKSIKLEESFQMLRHFHFTYIQDYYYFYYASTECDNVYMCQIQNPMDQT